MPESSLKMSARINGQKCWFCTADSVRPKILSAICHNTYKLITKFVFAEVSLSFFSLIISSDNLCTMQDKIWSQNLAQNITKVTPKVQSSEFFFLTVIDECPPRTHRKSRQISAISVLNRTKNSSKPQLIRYIFKKNNCFTLKINRGEAQISRSLQYNTNEINLPNLYILLSTLYKLHIAYCIAWAPYFVLAQNTIFTLLLTISKKKIHSNLIQSLKKRFCGFDYKFSWRHRKCIKHLRVF